MGRIPDYQAELLTACMQFLFSLPPDFLEMFNLIPRFQNPLIAALRLGREIPNIAHVALTALEEWMFAFPISTGSLLLEIRHVLDEYLHAPLDQGRPSKSRAQSRTSLKASLSTSSTSRGKSFTSLIPTLEKSMSTGPKVSKPLQQENLGVFSIQMQIVNFLGRSGSPISNLLSSKIDRSV